MSTVKSGEKVAKGYYLSFNKLDIKKVSEEGAVLQGKDGGNYINIPGILLIIIAPFVGGMFVVSFPFLLLAAVCIAPLYYFSRLVVRVIFGTVEQFKILVNSVKSFDWEPAAAYFNNNEKKSSDSLPNELKELAETVSSKRDKENK